MSDKNGLGTFNYQWLRDGVNIVNETKESYAVSSSDIGKTISVKITYTDDNGYLESITSSPVTITRENSPPLGIVSIDGIASDGQVLSVSNNLTDNDGMGQVSYQWLKNGKNINGATQSTLTLTTKDVGSKISVNASYIDLQGIFENVSSTSLVVTANTKPELNSIGKNWDIEVGKKLSIPLSVHDLQDDAFTIITTTTPKITNTNLSETRIDANTQLETIDFQWTPSSNEVNTVYKVQFKARETNTAQKLFSNVVSTQIRVWPLGDRNEASVNKIIVSTATWNENKLTLKGSIVLNPLLSITERNDFLAQKLDLTITSGLTGLGVQITKKL